MCTEVWAVLKKGLNIFVYILAEKKNYKNLLKQTMFNWNGTVNWGSLANPGILVFSDTQQN